MWRIEIRLWVGGLAQTWFLLVIKSLLSCNNWFVWPLGGSGNTWHIITFYMANSSYGVTWTFIWSHVCVHMMNDDRQIFCFLSTPEGSILIAAKCFHLQVTICVWACNVGGVYRASSPSVAENTAMRMKQNIKVLVLTAERWAETHCKALQRWQELSIWVMTVCRFIYWYILL